MYFLFVPYPHACRQWRARGCVQITLNGFCAWWQCRWGALGSLMNAYSASDRKLVRGERTKWSPESNPWKPQDFPTMHHKLKDICWDLSWSWGCLYTLTFLSSSLCLILDNFPPVCFIIKPLSRPQYVCAIFYLEPARRRTNVMAKWLSDHKEGMKSGTLKYIISATIKISQK